MGAVNFSLDIELVKMLKKHLPLNIFVETGTFKGDTLDKVKNIFKEIYSVELSKEYYEESLSRFDKNKNIHLYLNSSEKFLKELRPNLKNQSVLYWLDAHWCVADKTAGEKSQCPLLEELKSIHTLNQKSVIIIDDARLFISTPPKPHEISQWPDFDSVLNSLKKCSSLHQILILSDTILFYPPQIKKLVYEYAHSYSLDLLSVFDKSRDYEILLKQLNEKDIEISSLSRVLQEREEVILMLDNGIKEKESIISAKTGEISRKEEQIIGTDAKFKEKEKEIILLKDKLEESENKIESLDKLLKENEKIILFMNTEVIEEGKTIFTLSRDLVSKEEIISDLSEQLFQKEKEITRLSNGLTILKKRLSTPLWGIITLFQHHFPSIWEFIYNKVEDYKRKRKIKILPNHRKLKFFEPRLGKLYHHSPKPLKIPKSYFRNKTSSDKLKISIVTPSYNQGHYIKKTIESVLSQGYGNYEYIIQDNCSNDSTNSVLGDINESKLKFIIEKDSGQANAINRGFSKCSGDVMAWINSDDVYLPGTFDYIINYFYKHPEVDVVYGHRVLIDDNGNETGRWILPPHNKKALYYADFIPQETLFWRRNVWEKIGGKLDESYSFALDWDLLLRFQEAGAKIARLPRFLAAFRIHSLQKTSAQISSLGEEEMFRIRKKYLNKEVDYQEIRKNILYYLIYSEFLNKFYSIKLIRY